MDLKTVGVALFMAAGLVFSTAFSTAYAESSKKDEAVPKGEFDYIELSPLYFPVIDRHGASQMVSIVVSLEVKNQEDALEKINYLKPKIADAYIQAMYGRFGQGRGFMGADNMIDVVSLKSRLVDVTYKIVDQEHVHDVLLQIVQQRRI